MKKNLLGLATVALAALTMVSCSNPTKMAKEAEKVSSQCEPPVLECRADVIEARYTLSFPEKFFHPKAVVEVSPVLVYEGGEEAASSLWLQGEKVSENYITIPKTGGRTSHAIKFNYKEGMQVAQLELRGTLHYKDRTYPFNFVYKVADGTNITYKLVQWDPSQIAVPVLSAHNYQKVIPRTKEAQIKYLINNSTVRPKELSNADIQELNAFIAEVDNDVKLQAKGTQIIAYASPDGPLSLNETLSASRGKTASAALEKATKGVESKAPVSVSQVSEDWEGLQQMVAASDMQDKDLILRVLSMYSDPVVREKEIKNMSAVYKILADKVLPELRRARMIATVDYINFSDEELRGFVASNNIQGLDAEALIYAATLVTNNDDKLKLYTTAAEKYNDYRAYNNMAYVYLTQGNTARAKSALEKTSTKDDVVKTNMGIVALNEGNIAEATRLFTEVNSAQARVGLGAISILQGNYTDAASKLNGSGSFNEALVSVLTNNLAKAKSVLNNGQNETAVGAYLKAVVAAREGDSSAVVSNLRTAFAKDGKLAARAAKDIEFAKYKGSF